MGARAPQGGEKNLMAKFTGEICTCTPKQKVHPRQSKSPIFEEIWGDLGGGRGYLACVLTATNVKKVVNFLGEERCTPKENPA